MITTIYSVLRRSFIAALALVLTSASGFAAFGRFGPMGAGGCPFCSGGMGLGFDDGSPDWSRDHSTLPGQDTTVRHLPAEPMPRPPASANVPSKPVRFPPLLMAGVPRPGAERPFPEIKQGDDGYLRVGFEHLASFSFPMPLMAMAPKPGSLNEIPQKVQALEGKRVCVRGYMLPTKLESGLVREFLLIRNSMLCCYGVMPNPNEWIVVKMQGKPIASLMDTPLYLYGTLHVGQFYDQGIFAGLYQVDGEKISLN